MRLLAISCSLFAARALAGCVFANQDGASTENPHDENGELRRRDVSEDEALEARQQTRQLIGDLRYGITTPVGQSIANIILGSESGQSDVMGTKPTTTKACKADACCVWYNISSDITNILAQNGGCGDLARQVIRAGFHDAATWSAPREAKGKNCCGADGSLVLSGKELNRTENLGLDMVAGFFSPLYQKYRANKVGMADLIQYAANHATVKCTQGPRVRTFIGRKDNKNPGPAGILPEPTDTAAYIVSLFANKTFVSDDLISLVGAHSTGKQFYVNKTLAGEPFDQTPGIWDVFYYAQVQQPPQAGIFRLASDYALSTDSLTSARWNQLALGTQNQWNNAYAMAYVRMSLLGVNNINNLTECTKVLPMSSTD